MILPLITRWVEWFPKQLWPVLRFGSLTIMVSMWWLLGPWPLALLATALAVLVVTA